jgi:hypothetical protein
MKKEYMLLNQSGPCLTRLAKIRTMINFKTVTSQKLKK